jgi:hypothetical protein
MYHIDIQKYWILLLHLLCISKIKYFTFMKVNFESRELLKITQKFISMASIIVSCSRKIIVSSVYCKMDKPSSTRWSTTPLICPSPSALFISMANISTTMLNNNWDNGSPCQRLFFVWKFCPTSSFIFISTCPPWIIELIHWHHCLEIPFISKIFFTKGHFTLSYVFSKWVLEITPLCFFYATREWFHEG